MEWKKISRHILFTEVLVPTPGVSYNLRAVVIHHGDAGGGHYTAFIRKDEISWMHCDDSCIPSLVSAENVLSSEAYMLFYERDVCGL